jgi:hypothetical protein
MKRCGGGSIVNFGSISSMLKQGAMSVYITAKAAVQGLTRRLRGQIVGSGVRYSTDEGCYRTPLAGSSLPKSLLFVLSSKHGQAVGAASVASGAAAEARSVGNGDRRDELVDHAMQAFRPIDGVARDGSGVAGAGRRLEGTILS